MIETEIKKIEVEAEKVKLKKKKNKKGLILFFLILLGGGYFFYKFYPWDPQRPIKENLNLIKEGKTEKAYLLTSNGFKEETSSEVFKKFLKDHPEIESYKEIIFYKKTKEGDIIIFEGRLASKDKEIKIKYKVIKEEHRWKIHGIEVLE